MKELIKVGDEFEAQKGHIFHGEKIKIKKVENPTSKDGYGYFDTSKLIRRRKYNHTARVWWFLEFCKKVK